MRGRCARQRAELGGAIGVDAAIDDEVLAAGRHLERQAAGVGGVGHVDRRRRAGVGDDGRVAQRQALIARVRMRSWIVAPMPLKRARLPSWWRKKRRAGSMRSTAWIRAGGGVSAWLA